MESDQLCLQLNGYAKWREVSKDVYVGSLLQLYYSPLLYR